MYFNLRQLFYLFFTLLFSQTISSQNIFEQKYMGCNTSRFTTESDSIMVLPSQNIKSFFEENIRKDILKQLEGDLSFQIIVDEAGNSCLLSYENNTNQKDSRLQFKQQIDETLKWKRPGQRTSVIVA